MQDLQHARTLNVPFLYVTDDTQAYETSLVMQSEEFKQWSKNCSSLGFQDVFNSAPNPPAPSKIENFYSIKENMKVFLDPNTIKFFCLVLVL